MDTIKLIIDAAREGNVEKLHDLIKDDPLLLRAVALAGGDTPLHMACIRGHVDFTKEIVNLRPQFATELNGDGFSPLHIASASGDIDIVKELLRVVGSHLCLVKGKEKRVPLHYAVARGRIEVIKELLCACLDPITEVTVRGETCFHLAVKNSQFEAFKVLVEHVVEYEKEDLLNYKDELGNTILHLAASAKQYEVFDMLMDKNFGYKGKLEVTSSNKKGLTPLDELNSEGGDAEIQEMLISLARDTQHEEILLNVSQPENEPRGERRREERRSKSASKILRLLYEYDNLKDYPSKVKNTLLVIAVLIVTTTYQAVLSPPGGVWQDNYWPDTNTTTTTTNGSSGKQPPHHKAGEVVMGTQNPVSYGLFLLYNSIGFFVSLHMMHFLLSELPLQFELRVAIFALISNYTSCMTQITPNTTITVCFIVFSTLISLGMPILVKMIRDYRRQRRACQSTRASA